MPDPTKSPRLAVRTQAALLCALIFSAALSMEANPYDGLLLCSDMSSFGLGWWVLSANGVITSSNLNSSTAYSLRLVTELGLDTSTCMEDYHTCGGMLDIAFHFGVSLIILAERWASYPHEDQCLKTEMLKTRNPAIIRQRVVDGLALAFTLDKLIVEAVLGSPESIHSACLAGAVNYNMFPDMEWTPREARVSGIHLWSEVPDVVAQTLSKFIDERGIPIDSSRGEDDKDEFLDDEKDELIDDDIAEHSGNTFNGHSRLSRLLRPLEGLSSDAVTLDTPAVVNSSSASGARLEKRRRGVQLDPVERPSKRRK